MNLYERELENYQKLNKFAAGNGVVLFGSSFFKDIPVCELKQSFHMDMDMYNRSFVDLSVFDAANLLEDCVISLSPRKVLLNLGETDLERGYHSIPEMITAYENIIKYLKSADKDCEVLIVSVCNTSPELHPEELNKQLELLAEKTNCKFADISPAFSHDTPGIKAFSLLKLFMRDRLSFSDAMNLVVV